MSRHTTTEYMRVYPPILSTFLINTGFFEDDRGFAEILGQLYLKKQV